MEEGAGTEPGRRGPGKLLRLFAKKWTCSPTPDVQLHAAVYLGPTPTKGWGSHLAPAEQVKGMGH